MVVIIINIIIIIIIMIIIKIILINNISMTQRDVYINYINVDYNNSKTIII